MLSPLVFIHPLDLEWQYGNKIWRQGMKSAKGVDIAKPVIPQDLAYAKGSRDGHLILLLHGTDYNAAFNILAFGFDPEERCALGP